MLFAIQLVFIEEFNSNFCLSTSDLVTKPFRAMDKWTESQSIHWDDFLVHKANPSCTIINSKVLLFARFTDVKHGWIMTCSSYKQQVMMSKAWSRQVWKLVILSSSNKLGIQVSGTRSFTSMHWLEYPNRVGNYLLERNLSILSVCTLRIEPHSSIRLRIESYWESNCRIDSPGSNSAHLDFMHIWIFLNFKLPIRMRRFEINWSASKIRSPRASGRVLTCTLNLSPFQPLTILGYTIIRGSHPLIWCNKILVAIDSYTYTSILIHNCVIKF